MKLKCVSPAFILLAGVVFVAGCEDTVSNKQVKARPPAATPAPIPEFVAQALPLPEHPVDLAQLYDRRPAIDVLVAKVQVSFDAAQKEYKAGEFDKARTNYDQAVSLIVASGFQVDSDPRLSDLFDQIGETLHSYELNEQQSAEDEEVNPGTPAPTR